MTLVLCVPARRFASCQLTTRARMSPRTGRPKMSSASSMSPTSSLSRLRTVSLISSAPRRALGFSPSRRLTQRSRKRQPFRRLAFDRILDEDIAARAARHRSFDHQDIAFGVGRDHFETLGGHPFGPQMSRHLFVLEHLSGRCALPGRTMAAMRDRYPVAGAQSSEIMALHRTGKSLADTGAGDIDILPGDEMRGGNLGSHFEQRILGDAELCEPRLGLYLGLREMATKRLRYVLGLGGTHTKLHRGIPVLLLSSHGDDLAIIDLEHRHRDVVSVFGEDA